MREINQAGLTLIKSFEGIPDGDPTTVNKDPYLDPVGIWTIGWGHAIWVNGGFLRGPENRKVAKALYLGGLTLKQCETLLKGDLADFCRDVEALLKVKVTDNQFAALVSFAFNVGINALKNSSILRLVNGGDFKGAAGRFLLYNKATKNGVKVVLAGLTRRREAEAKLFMA